MSEINLIIFPDWSQPEESLGEELAQVIRAVAAHPDNNLMTLLIDTSNISEEEAQMIVTSVVMNLLMQEDLEVSQEPAISLVEKLGAMQWDVLLRHIQARIVLKYEDRKAITTVKADNLPAYLLDSLNHNRVIQRATGNWIFQG